MAHHRVQLPLVMGFIGSIVLHLSVILPMLLIVLTTRGEPDPLRAELQPETERDKRPEPPEQRDKPLLGLDAPNPSSLTWVGYEEYEQHLARLSKVEQAAFRMTETGLPEPQASVPREVSPEAVPTELTESPQPDDVEVEVDVDAPESAIEREQTREADSSVDVAPDVAEETEDVPVLARLLSPFDWTGANIGFLLESHDEPSPQAGEAFDEKAAARTKVDETPAEDAPADAEDAEIKESEMIDSPSGAAQRDETESPEPTEQSPQHAAPPQQGEPEEGEVSDREAEATSTIKVPPENWRLGRPLAAQGVELKPQRPHFTMLQRLTASPGNPLVEIRFGRDGAPVDASVVKSSGDQSIDTFLESSLYRWRASGKELDALRDDKTFDVRIQIIFNPRLARRASESDQ